MSKAKMLLFNLLTLALLLVMFALPVFPQIEYRARATLAFMIFGLILIVVRKGKPKDE